MSKKRASKPYKVNKYVSNPLFKMTEKEHEAIEAPIRRNLANMKQSVFTQTDWFNVFYRIRVGVYIVEKFYTEDTLEQFQPSLNACKAIEKRASLVKHTKWTATSEEIEEIEIALEAVSTLQRQSTRKTFLQAHKEVQLNMVNEFIA